MVSSAQKNSENWRTGEVRNLAEDLRQITLYIVAKTLFNADRELMAEFVDEIGGAMLAVQEVQRHRFRRLALLARLAANPTQPPPTARVENLEAPTDRKGAGPPTKPGDRRSFARLWRSVVHAPQRSHDEEGEPMDAQQLRERVGDHFCGRTRNDQQCAELDVPVRANTQIAAAVHDEVDTVLKGRSLRWKTCPT
jgi:hypothetical protein